MENLSFSEKIQPLNEKTKETLPEVKKSKLIQEKLKFLIENDSDSVDFYSERLKDVSEKFEEQLRELKGFGFEKATEAYLRLATARQYLSQVKGAESIVQALDAKSDELKDKLKRHRDKYEVDIEQKLADYPKESLEISKIDEEIEKQKEIVNNLQDLIINDDEFSSEYIRLLDDAAKKMSLFEKDRQLFIIDKTERMLNEVPFTNEILRQIGDLKNQIEIVHKDGNKILENEIDWELLPPGEIPEGVYAPKNKHENSWNSMINSKRLEYIRDLGPETIYRSINAPYSRQYEIFIFQNCAVLCSPWTSHAVYVLPKEGWQNFSRLTKANLRNRGAIQLKNINGWEERLENILTGKKVLEFDLNSPPDAIIGPIEENWGETTEDWARYARNGFVEKFPEIKLCLSREENKKAMKIIADITGKDLPQNFLYTCYRKFSKFSAAKRAAFPEFKFSDEELRASKKYKWKDASIQQMKDNVASAIKENFPELHEAIEREDYDTALMWFDEFRADTFEDIGLKYVSDGKVKELGGMWEALRMCYPKLKLKAKRRRNLAYENLQQRHQEWGRRYREVLIQEVPELKEAAEKMEWNRVSYLIISKLKEEGAQAFVEKHINSIRGVKGLLKQTDFLRVAFPEIDWPNVNFGRKNIK
jgi:hypothetical protein